jgi:hypothetical protein
MVLRSVSRGVSLGDKTGPVRSANIVSSKLSPSSDTFLSHPHPLPSCLVSALSHLCLRVITSQTDLDFESQNPICCFLLSRPRPPGQSPLQLRRPAIGQWPRALGQNTGRGVTMTVTGEHFLLCPSDTRQTMFLPPLPPGIEVNRRCVTAAAAEGAIAAAGREEERRQRTCMRQGAAPRCRMYVNIIHVSLLHRHRGGAGPARAHAGHIHCTCCWPALRGSPSRQSWSLSGFECVAWYIPSLTLSLPMPCCVRADRRLCDHGLVGWSSCRQLCPHHDAGQPQRAGFRMAARLLLVP